MPRWKRTRNITLVVSDGYLVLASSDLVSRRHTHDAVRVNVIADLNLWNATRSRSNAGQLELAEKFVVLRHGSLSLIDLDQYSGLVVSVGGKYLGVFDWNGRVALNEGRHYAISSLDTEG